jgi:ABC-2 type transport system permease protein
MSGFMKSFTLEAGAEVLKSFRAPEFIIPTLGMPVAFYALFALVIPGNSGNAGYLLATYGVFAVMGPAIFGFGISVANERDKGWLTLKRAAPSRGINYIGAKICSTLLFSAMAVAIIYIVAGFVGDVAMPRSAWAALLMTHLLATFPFILIGLCIGFLCNGNAAVAISNIFFLGFAALGGLWIPIMVFPPAMQTFANFLPTFHLSEIALAMSGAPGERDVSYHVIVLVIMTVVLAAATAFAWTKQRNQ